MDLKATIKQKLQDMSKREKAIALITILMVTTVVPYIFLYSPTEKTLKTKKDTIETLQKDIEKIDASVKAQAEVKEPAPGPVGLPEADDLQGMYMSISREAYALGIDFISIAPEGVTHKEGFTEMRLKLELRLRYRQLYDFVRYLRERHKLFLIESLRFETNDAVYPSGIALIKAVTYLKKK